MTRKRKTITWIVIAVIVAGAAAIAVRTWLRRSPIKPVSLAGAVLRQDSDPKKQSPIANTQVSVTGGESSGSTKSDTSGLFNLTLRQGVERGEPITLRFEH